MTRRLKTVELQVRYIETDLVLVYCSLMISVEPNITLLSRKLERLECLETWDSSSFVFVPALLPLPLTAVSVTDILLLYAD